MHVSATAASDTATAATAAAAAQAHLLLALKSRWSWPDAVTATRTQPCCMSGFAALLGLALCHGILWPPAWLWTLNLANEATVTEPEAADGVAAEACRSALSSELVTRTMTSLSSAPCSDCRHLPFT